MPGSYIEDGFVTIGAFLEKIKLDFQKIVKGDVKVVQGESIPESLSGCCVLCIHNLAPVKKVDPTWTVCRTINSMKRVLFTTCALRFLSTTPSITSSRMWMEAELKPVTSRSNVYDGATSHNCLYSLA
jgi:hypothetical protein